MLAVWLLLLSESKCVKINYKIQRKIQNTNTKYKYNLLNCERSWLQSDFLLSERRRLETLVCSISLGADVKINYKIKMDYFIFLILFRF